MVTLGGKRPICWAWRDSGFAEKAVNGAQHRLRFFRMNPVPGAGDYVRASLRELAGNICAVAVLHVGRQPTTNE
ncbi:hypothetical protein D3C87_1745430 [compost metagenome]